MTVSTKEVLAFIKMTPFNKVRLQKDDPERYEELKKEAKKQFDPESDPALKDDVVPKKK
jgi:hypothetical protein